MKDMIKNFLMCLAVLFLTGCVTKTVVVTEYMPLELHKELTKQVVPTQPPSREALSWKRELSREANLENQVKLLKPLAMQLYTDVGICNQRLETIETTNQKLVAKAKELNKERMKK